MTKIGSDFLDLLVNVIYSVALVFSIQSVAYSASQTDDHKRQDRESIRSSVSVDRVSGFYLFCLSEHPFPINIW